MYRNGWQGGDRQECTDARLSDLKGSPTPQLVRTSTARVEQAHSDLVACVSVRSRPGFATPLAVVVCAYRRWVTLAQTPYFVWVSIATVFQLKITAMNWGR